MKTDREIFECPECGRTLFINIPGERPFVLMDRVFCEGHPHEIGHERATMTWRLFPDLGPVNCG